MTELPKETQGKKNLRSICIDNIKVSNIKTNSRNKFKFAVDKQIVKYFKYTPVTTKNTCIPKSEEQTLLDLALGDVEAH